MKTLLTLVLSAAVALPVASTVVDDLRERAAEGDSAALFSLGTLYDRGYDTIAADSVLSRRYLREAAEKGHTAAMNLLGYRLSLAGDDSLRAEGLHWLETAAILGDAKAAANIGWLLMEGRDVERNYEKALFWLEKGASQGLPIANSQLGDLYRYGLGVEADSVKADSLYVAAFESGYRDAGYRLADLRNATHKEQSAEENLADGLFYYLKGAPRIGVRFFEKAAGAGNARAMALLGDAYTRAQGVAYDHEKSLGYYIQAAEGGNPSAMFILAELLDIFPDSYPEPAAVWYDRAEGLGVTDAATAMRLLLTP